MSRGISWRQKVMLGSIATQARRSKIVAWRDIDNGPKEDDFSSRMEWNHEQTVRRALHSLERRGLVELGRYCFEPEPTWNGLTTAIVWTVIDPDKHVPGDSRIMIGAKLTEVGEAIVAEEERRRQDRRTVASS